MAPSVLGGCPVIFEKDHREGRAFTRSREMTDCLRKELLYSEKRPRDTMFRTIEELLAEQESTGQHGVRGSPPREAAARAQSDPAASAAAVRWDVTSRTVIKAMIGAEVLLTPDGRPI